MVPRVLLAGDDLPALIGLAIELGPTTTQPTIVESVRPLAALVRRPAGPADAGVVALHGSENVAELYELFRSHPGTPFVLLTPAFPANAALARVAAKHDSIFLPRGEATVVIAATVVSLLAQTGAISS
jgi:hypothetical protein